jgi:hypothetical protein
MLYNPQTHPIHGFANKLLEDFEQSLYDIVTERLGDMLSQSTDIDLTLETYPLCFLAKKPKDETSSKCSSVVNTSTGLEMNQEATTCLTRRVSFLENDCKRELETSSSEINNDNNQDDDETCESKHNNEIDEGDFLPGLSRQDSTDSLISMNDWPRRPDHSTSQVCQSGDMRSQVDRKVFEKSQLGQKGVMTLMSELSRNVCRLKDDMYVITFTDSAPGDYASLSCPPTLASSAADLTTMTLETSSAQGGKGKGKSLMGQTCHPLPSQLLKTTTEFEKIPSVCLALLEHIKPDTSDPDSSIYCPFIDSRQTFLEMCQFRHYQFDSLRRAKYSSVMLLYHLMYPLSKYTRPRCSECQSIITTVRWHCTLCLDSHYDVCNNCFSIAQLNHEHHDLTPARLSYI